jgi:hypothetical protein
MTLTLRARGGRLLAGLIAGVILSVSVSTYLAPPIWEADLDPSRFRHVKGYEYEIPYNPPPVFSLRSDPTRRLSKGIRFRLLEDARALGPELLRPVKIAEQGMGRFSYWRRHVFFSASDNSDPRSNGRTYRVAFPLYVSPYVMGAALFVFLLAVAGIERAARFARKIAKPAIAIAFGLTLAVSGAELFLRSDLAKTKLVGVLGGYENFPERLRPTLNSHGFRDVEHTVAKPAGVVRIIVLGDSMTFGHGVADDEIWPRRLAELAGPQVEIIIMAQNGWGTADHLDVLRRKGIAYDPDLVAVGVVENDLQPPMWEPSGIQADWLIFRTLASRLYLFRWMDYEINRFADRLGWRYNYDQWLSDSFDPARDYFPRWQRTVAEFRDLLQQAGVPGYAFVLTSPIRPSGEVNAQRYETLRQEFAKNGFVSVNLQPAFVHEFGPDGGKHLWALPNDPHPGPVLQQFFAREIWAALAPAVRTSRARNAAR